MIMKKIYSIIASAIIAVGFTACTQSDFVETSAPDVSATSIDNAIQFGTYLGKLGTTRTYVKGSIANATDADNGITDLKEAEFGVFAYHTSDATDANANYNPASVGSSPSNIAPNFMYNQHITWNASSPAAWVYTPVKYWPNGLDAASTHQGSGASSQMKYQKLSFFAYAPYTTATSAYSGTYPTALSATTDALQNDNTNGIKAITTNAFTGNVWIKYLMPKAQEDEAVDLLWGVRGAFQYKETDNGNNPDPALTSLTGTDYNINLTKQLVDEKVAFLFKHALAKIGGQTYATASEDAEAAADGDKIGFKIVADVDVNTEATAGDHDNQTTYLGSDFDRSKTLITLKSIKIQDGKTASDDVETSVSGITSTGLYNSGWFNIETGTWDQQETTGNGATVSIVAKSVAANQSSTDDTDYSINPEIREAASYSNYAGSGAKKLASGDAAWASGNPTGVYTTAVPVFAKETIPGITLIPGGTSNLYITVDYLVRTADPNLATGFSEVEQVISNKVSLASLQPNKFYTIIIHLGMTSVKFEAVVADWQTTVGGTYAENGTFTPGTGSDANQNESHFWLPSNVVTP